MTDIDFYIRIENDLPKIGKSLSCIKYEKQTSIGPDVCFHRKKNDTNISVRVCERSCTLGKSFCCC